MASLGAASTRAACEYPVGTQWDCFREAEVWGRKRKKHLVQTGSPASEDPGVIAGSVGYLVIPLML